MKFLGGFITGVVTVILLMVLMVASESNGDLAGVTLLPEKGDCITKNNLEIFQTLEPNTALAKFGDNKTVLLVNDEGKSYYDGLKIQVSGNECARQTGTFQYETKLGMPRTVPVVVIE